MKSFTCGFIGLGLIGGSIARALRAASDTKSNNCDICIYAWDPDNASLDLAVSEGVVDKPLLWPDTGFSECDIVFLCAPVGRNNENLPIIKEILAGNDATIITDVGSVKNPIHSLVEKEGLSHRFIGGHPMAGSERFGYRNSSALILQNAYYILTPGKDVPVEAIENYKYLVELTGALPLIIEPSEHDRVTAAISHLPHVIASALVNLVKNKDGKDGLMKTMAAGGFKDITRIASSSPDMWEQICLTNTDNILSMLDDFMAGLSDIRESISRENGPRIHDFFDSARVYRDSFIGTSYGPIKKAFDLFINIADEPGVIAQISTTLAVHQVNIKNLGIIHNRELAEGALRIEFHSEEDINKARALLSAKGYEIVKNKTDKDDYLKGAICQLLKDL